MPTWAMFLQAVPKQRVVCIDLTGGEKRGCSRLSGDGEWGQQVRVFKQASEPRHAGWTAMMHSPFSFGSSQPSFCSFPQSLTSYIGTVGDRKSCCLRVSSREGTTNIQELQKLLETRAPFPSIYHSSLPIHHQVLLAPLLSHPPLSPWPLSTPPLPVAHTDSIPPSSCFHLDLYQPFLTQDNLSVT